jgi:hypothetical protein
MRSEPNSLVAPIDVTSNRARQLRWMCGCTWSNVIASHMRCRGAKRKLTVQNFCFWRPYIALCVDTYCVSYTFYKWNICGRYLSAAVRHMSRAPGQPISETLNMSIVDDQWPAIPQNSFASTSFHTDWHILNLLGKLVAFQSLVQYNERQIWTKIPMIAYRFWAMHVLCLVANLPEYKDFHNQADFIYTRVNQNLLKHHVNLSSAFQY